MDPYKVLGLDKDASPDEIRRAYRSKAAKFHPDKDGEVWIFQQIQDAYDELSGKKKKKRSANGRTPTSESKPNSEKGSSPDSAANKKQDSNSEFEKEKPNSTSSFDFSPKEAQKRSHRSRSANQKLLLTVIGIIGGFFSALFVAWIIIGSQWFDAARTALTNTQSVEQSPVSDSKSKQPSVGAMPVEPIDSQLNQAQTAKGQQDQGIINNQNAVDTASSRDIAQSNIANNEPKIQDAPDESESSFKSNENSPRKTIADATIADTKFVPIGVGQPVFLIDAKSAEPNWQWSKIPRKFQSWEYSQLPKHHGKSLIKINQSGVVFLLVNKDWGQGGSSGIWQHELTTEEQFALDGWVKVKTTIGHDAERGNAIPVQFEYTHPSGGINYFELWQKQVEAGSTLSLRTHKYVAPMIIRPTTVDFEFQENKSIDGEGAEPSSGTLGKTHNPNTDLLPVAMTTVQGGKFVPLVVGETVHTDRPIFRWSQIPIQFNGWEYSQLPRLHGKSNIKVVKSGVLYLLIHSGWGKGGSQGEWQNEITTREKMIEDGWYIEPEPSEEQLHQNWLSRNLFEYENSDGHSNFELWSRKVDAGTTISIRTQKYIAPIVIQPPR